MDSDNTYDQYVTEPLPIVFERWLLDIEPGGMPRERNATCNDCAMCAPLASTGPQFTEAFTPSVKCCTYMPFVPNFLVGLALADSSATIDDGASLAKRLAMVGCAHPLGLLVPEAYRAHYFPTSRIAFGRSPSLLCPHFVSDGGGLCGIWKYRNAECATWFCKHVRGGTGAAAWQALRDLFEVAQRELALHCAVELGADPGPLFDELDSVSRDCNADNLARELVPQSYDAHSARVWGRWNEQRNSFYTACGRIVAGMNWPEVVALCGIRVRERDRIARQAIRRLKRTSIPDKMSLGRLTVLRSDAHTCDVVSYSSRDSITIRKALLSILILFDGARTTQRIREVARAQHDLTITTDELWRLLDFGILLEKAN